MINEIVFLFPSWIKSKAWSNHLAAQKSVINIAEKFNRNRLIPGAWLYTASGKLSLSVLSHIWRDSNSSNKIVTESLALNKTEDMCSLAIVLATKYTEIGQK